MTLPQPAPISIKMRLVLAIVLATAVASIVTAGFSMWREAGAYAETKQAEANSLASLFASVAVQAVANHDVDGAHRVLGAMRHLPKVLHVRLVDDAGAILAEHGFGGRLTRGGEGAPGTSPSFFIMASGHPLAVEQSIVQAGLPIGKVELLVATDDLQRRLAELAAQSASAAAMALLLGYLAAHGLRRSISGRIESVTAAMRTVEATHGYDTLLPAGRRDEFGPLVDSFNAMMREIGARDRLLADHRSNLETEIRHRTIDLVEAKHAADAANAAKSQFLATMSHEIRTPLNGLMVMAELLASADLETRERRYADVIVRSGGTLLAIINDVLDFSKIEAGRIEIEAIPFDLADVAEDVCQLFASKASAQGLDLAAYVDPALGGFIGDPVRIGQIIGNLVNNAIKFTAAGHVFVEVTPDPERSGQILIAVADTGIGIAADKLDAVFDSFSQADQSITRRYGGTGLGLSISQRLATAMGGRIGVTSRLGEGSRFWFSIPLQPQEDWRPIAIPAFAVGGVEAATGAALARYVGPRAAGPGAVVVVDPRSARSAADPESEGAAVVALSRIGDSDAENWIAEGRAAAALPWPIRRRELAAALSDARSGCAPARGARSQAEAGARYPHARVLVADDSPVNREVASEALRRFGISPETACDGEEARRRAEAGGYALILMDGSMPVLDGFEASRAIRADERRDGRPRQPIVALTAHAMGEAGRWREAEMDGLLLKPFSLAQLAACLAQHLPAAPSAPRADAALAEALAPAEPPTAADAVDPQPGDLLEPTTMEMLAMLAAADANSVRQIVAIFIEHAGPALGRMREAAAGPAQDGLAAAAHAFKSMALSVGAKALAETLGAVEAEARRGAEAGCAIPFPDIERLLARSVDAIETQPWMRDAPDGGSGSNPIVSVA